MSDDRLACIKEVKASDDLETRIALILSKIDSPANHSVPKIGRASCRERVSPSV